MYVHLIYRTISHSGIFYCHPHLLRSLGVHLTVLGLMRSYLGISVTGMEEDKFLTARRKMKMAMSKVQCKVDVLSVILYISQVYMNARRD